MKRKAGVLCAISSLPGTLGVGDFGESAYEFVDMLANNKIKIWQILPLNPLGYGNSPYQSYSAFAGDEIYISLETLFQEMDLNISLLPVITSTSTFENTRTLKTNYLKEAFTHFKSNKEYKEFIKKAHWLKDYAKFMSLKQINNEEAWTRWKYFDVSDEMLQYQYFVQFIFYKQWKALKHYANTKGIEIMGDIPFYLGHDSADVYYHKNLFELDESGMPTLVAGVPPDYFSEDGQLWGNPIYNWKQIKKEGYKSWLQRLAWNQDLYDIIRLDHFRAFDTYWVIPAENTTAKNGTWELGPSYDFFETVYKNLEDIHLIAEDLGDLRPEVITLKDDFDLMGMHVIQFDFDFDQTRSNTLVYTSTHDNQPLRGWLKDKSWFDRFKLNRWLSKKGIKEKTLVKKIIVYTLGLNANWAMVPIQDIMGFSKEATLNTPGTVGSPNWEWKLKDFSNVDIRLEVYSKWLSTTNRI